MAKTKKIFCSEDEKCSNKVRYGTEYKVALRCHIHKKEGDIDVYRKQCIATGCTNNVVSNKVCRTHGAERYTCTVEGCSNQANIAAIKNK